MASSAPPDTPRQHLVVMGVSGAGKTTLAEGVAAALGWSFCEGDLLHPASNVAKMAAGDPLTDEDRWPWLQALADWIGARASAGRMAPRGFPQSNRFE